MTWASLAAIEADAGKPADARQAKQKATACYLAHRRDGGENHNSDGRLCLTVTQHLLAGDTDGAEVLLQQLAAGSDLPKWFRPFFDGLQAIVAGSRDQSLAEAPDLHYTSATELRFLLEKLEAPR